MLPILGKPSSSAIKLGITGGYELEFYIITTAWF